VHFRDVAKVRCLGVEGTETSLRVKVVQLYEFFVEPNVGIFLAKYTTGLKLLTDFGGSALLDLFDQPWESLNIFLQKIEPCF
jgi:hypothetical protein